MMLKNFARTMVCISFVFAAAPSFAGKIIDDNNGTLHAQENFGGGRLTVSVGNFSSNVTYHGVSFGVVKCPDSSQQNCTTDVPRTSMGNIPPGATQRMTVPAPPNSCYFTTISVNGIPGELAINFPIYCVGPS